MGKQMYVIKRIDSGLYFAGFDSEHNAVWCTEAKAKSMDKLVARAQALLLSICNPSVQRKPVSA